MRKGFGLFLCLALLCGCGSVSKTNSAQTAPTPENRKSKLELFSAQSGKLIEKRFDRLGNIPTEMNSLDLSVVTFTDVQTKEKVSGIQLEGKALSAAGNRAVTAFIDADEVDALLKSLRYLRATVFLTKADTYTEYLFLSRSGFMAGCFYSKEKWQPFVQPSRVEENSLVSLAPAGLDQLIAKVEQGKAKLQ